MKARIPRSGLVGLLLLCSLLVLPAMGQRRARSAAHSKNAVLWENVDIPSRDLFYGPGGRALEPDLSKITYLEEDKNGHNKKYRIKDGSGREWVAKLGREARPETAAVRLLWGLGYKTEINYLVPSLTIPGKGTFTNVRLELRPDDVDRGDIWKWRDNPFVGTNELQGLKIMMVFMTNWDLLDMQNKILNVKRGGRVEHDYVISDLGATFGKLGNNNLPIFFRLGRKTGDPKAWSRTHFIRHIDDGEIEFAFKGKGRDLMKDITVRQGRWLSDRLNQLREKQIRDAFRAANFSPAEVDLLTRTTQKKIRQLAETVNSSRLAMIER